MSNPAVRGRGASENPANRFHSTVYERDPAPPEPGPRTTFIDDHSKSLITYNDSPDVGFDAGINPYRGCEHGCIYCYARPLHEYLGFSSGLDFESKIMVKHRAPVLLRDELTAKKWKPQVVGVSGATDPYQPAEHRFRLTRACLEVFLEFRNPIVVITKNQLVTRDIDLLAQLAEHHCVAVYVSITTRKADLARTMEPRTSSPQARLAAIQQLSAAGIPTGVFVAPVVPGLTDEELPAILEAAAGAGARAAGFIMLRLPHAVAAMFENWLTQHAPLRKERVLQRLREMRGGELSESTFGDRMRGQGAYAEQIQAMFKLACRRNGLDRKAETLSTDAFRRPGEAEQLDLL